jgi:glutamate--cysteine ligase
MRETTVTVEVKCAAWDVVADRQAAEGYVASVCFKTGPPRRLGVELEWTVHHENGPATPIVARDLRAVLGAHTPKTLDPASPHLPLDHGGVVTVEPGGQVEISTPAADSLSRLLRDTSRDVEQLRRLLAGGGLLLGEAGCDPHRPPVRIIETPRYRAMEQAFDVVGPAGRVMMCSTASVQVCVDIGQTLERAAARWDALHAIGPTLIALFANSPHRAGRDTGWASSRMDTWYHTDPVRTGPPQWTDDSVAEWTRRVIDTPLLCLRRPDGCWEPPPETTFAGWVDGALDARPTFDDLDYHLSTLFPPVRARGHFEVRYLDAQPGDDWQLPLAMVAALFAREQTVDAALELTRPVAHHWVAAARDGLADPDLAAVAPALIELAGQALPDTGLSGEAISDLTQRLRAKAGGDHDRL